MAVIEQNKKKILEGILLRKPRSAKEIQEATGFSDNTVVRGLLELAEEGLVIETTGQKRNRRWRKAPPRPSDVGSEPVTVGTKSNEVQLEMKEPSPKLQTAMHLLKILESLPEEDRKFVLRFLGACYSRD